MESATTSTQFFDKLKGLFPEQFKTRKEAPHPTKQSRHADFIKAMSQSAQDFVDSTVKTPIPQEGGYEAKLSNELKSTTDLASRFTAIGKTIAQVIEDKFTGPLRDHGNKFVVDTIYQGFESVASLYSGFLWVGLNTFNVSEDSFENLNSSVHRLMKDFSKLKLELNVLIQNTLGIELTNKNCFHQYPNVQDYFSFENGTLELTEKLALATKKLNDERVAEHGSSYSRFNFPGTYKAVPLGLEEDTPVLQCPAAKVPVNHNLTATKNLLDYSLEWLEKIYNKYLFK